jgi:hypothetical protein
VPYTWLNSLLGVAGAVLLAAAVLLIGLAILRGKGRRKRPLLGAMGCLVAFIAVGAANYALIFLVQLPSLARDDRLQQQAHETSAKSPLRCSARAMTRPRSWLRIPMAIGWPWMICAARWC